MGKLIWNYCVICWIGGAIYYGYQYFANSDKRDLEQYLQCGYSATTLRQKEAEEVIALKTAKFIQKNKLDLSQYEFLELVGNAKNYVRFDSDPMTVFNSKTCRKIHEKPELTIHDIVSQ